MYATFAPIPRLLMKRNFNTRTSIFAPTVEPN
jgi:hypothetical protein